MKQKTLLLILLLWGHQTFAGDGFITTWRITSNKTIDVPIPSIHAYSYNYNVDWGDGNISQNITGSASHTYAEVGTYTVEITGNFPSISIGENWVFGDSPHEDIRTIEQWGNIEWESMKDAFAGCIFLTSNASDAPNLTKVTDMSGMFAGTKQFNSIIGNWDVSNVTNFSRMFSDASSFNQDISNWNVSNGTNFSYMFGHLNNPLSNGVIAAFNQDISNWDVSKGVNFSNMFRGASFFDQDISNWDVSNGTDFSGMLRATHVLNQDISNWNVSNGIDFSYMFSSAVIFNQDISNWDVSKGTNYSNMFSGASSFNQDISNWNVSNGTDFSYMFRSAKVFNQDISNWGVSNGTDFSYMFRSAKVFNQDISNWDVSNGADFSYMFSGAATFNQDIGNWDVSNGTDFRLMFRDATAFNQGIGNWDVSKGTSFSDMFRSARVFNQDISNWNVSKGIYFSGMFYQATAFNQNIGNWDVSKGTSFSFMFHQAIAFNQNIGNWDVSNGITFRDMFSHATAFNQDIGNWDVSKGTHFSYMFDGATAFNQDIGNWDVSNGASFAFSGMFNGAITFNQDISNWDVSKGTDFSDMFSRATSFNQNLGSWNITNAKYMDNMFDSSGINIHNYDAILTAWANQAVQSYLNFGAKAIQYCFALDVRNKLINNHGWQISDGGRKCDFGFIGLVFHDINQNQMQDADEYGLANQKVMLLPDNCITITDADGNYHFSVPSGDYEVVILPQDYFELSTDSSSYHLSFPKDDGQPYSFGLKSTQNLYKVSSSLTSAPTRCGFTVPFWLSYQNDGTILTDGKVKLIPDPAVSFVSSSQPFSTSGDTLIWDYSDLRPSETRQIELSFEMPGVDGIGDSLTFIHLVEAIENNVAVVNFTDSLISEIRCAYDPNDKTATPFGIGDEHLTLKDDFIEYRIRFQNTGNDTAFNIIVRDTLQAEFDINTVEVIASSHSMRTQIEIQDGALAFYFEDILLPDSLVDESNSHGFVTFKVKPKSGLPDSTKVFNTAYIYFDFNPAIQTNYTFNTLVDELPNNKVTGLELEDVSEQVSIFPNPNSSGQLMVKLSNSFKGNIQLSITDITGRELSRKEVNLQTKQDLELDISSLHQGLYFISIIQKDKRAVKKLIKR